MLDQTELFAHFLDIKSNKDEALQKVLEEKRKEAKADEGWVDFFLSSTTILNHDPIVRSRRRRKTEKEEDEEILKDESGESGEQLTVFTSSPACRSNRCDHV